MLYDWYQHIYFSQPAWFWLFALIPLLIWREVSQSGRTQATVMMSTVRAFRGARSWKTTLRPLPLFLRLLALTCLIIGLARPQSHDDEQIVNGEGIEALDGLSTRLAESDTVEILHSIQGG